MSNNIVVINCYILKYVFEPNTILYFKDNDDKVFCTTSILSAYHFNSRIAAVDKADELKRTFDLDFSIDII